MKNYLELGQRILNEGQFYGDRTKVGRVSIFGADLRFNLQEGFPLVTTKKIFTKGIIAELLWFLKGSSNVQELIDQGVHIWDDWRVTQELLDNLPERIQAVMGDPNDPSMEYQMAKDELNTHLGSIGPLYGKMWREAPGGADTRPLELLFGNNYIKVMDDELASDKKSKLLVNVKDKDPSTEEYKHALFQQYYGVDQIQQLIINLKRNPHSSRHVISCWMPELLPDERLTPEENVFIGKMALAPCHVMFQCYVKDPKEEGGKMRLSLKLTQR